MNDHNQFNSGKNEGGLDEEIPLIELLVEWSFDEERIITEIAFKR